MNEPASRDLTVLRAGRLVDVDAGAAVADRLIFVRGDSIEAVEPSAGTAIPNDARVVDLSAHTLIPGMIDCHAHLVGAIEGASLGALLENTEARDALLGVKNARDTLEAGFTTVRDIGTFRAFTDLELRRAINEGMTPGPRMMCAGAYVTVSGGGGELTGLAPDVILPDSMRFGVSNTEAEVRANARAILNRGADFIKVIATGAVLAPGTKPGVAEFSEAEIRAAVEVADDYGTHVAAHAHGPEGIKNAIRAGVRSVEHGSLIDDEAINMMAERGTYLVADIYCGDYIEEEGRRAGWSPEVLEKNELTTDAQRRGFSQAVEAGVRLAFGTDSGVYPHGWNANQLAYMVKYGLSPIGAIRSATLWAAELMGWSDRIGSIAAGKYADIVAVEGDASSDVSLLTSPDFVMKNGEIVRGPNAGPEA